MTSTSRPSVAPSVTHVLPRMPGRRGVLLVGGVALVLGLYTGLARGGIEHRFLAADLHAVLMVLGFLGTVFAMLRANEVAHGWAVLAPASSAVGVLALPWARSVGATLLLLAGCLLSATYLATGADERRTTADVLGLLGALAWVAAAVLWLLGAGPIRITPLLAAFLVFTLVRTQAARDRHAGRDVALGGTILGSASLLAVGAVMALPWRSSGLVVTGLGLVALASGLAPSVRRRLADARGPLPRFEATCVALATGWLSVSGVLWIAAGVGLSGALIHDAVVHSLFLGAVLTHVMGLTPTLLPALLRVPPVFNRSAVLAVTVLQVSVLVRIGADLAGSATWRELALHGNVGALLLFLFLTGAGLRRARRTA